MLLLCLLAWEAVTGPGTRDPKSLDWSGGTLRAVHPAMIPYQAASCKQSRCIIPKLPPYARVQLRCWCRVLCCSLHRMPSDAGHKACHAEMGATQCCPSRAGGRPVPQRAAGGPASRVCAHKAVNTVTQYSNTMQLAGHWPSHWQDCSKQPFLNESSPPNS